jgi:hypothetical protein
MKKQKICKKNELKINKEKTREVFVEPDRIRIGDIEVQSMVYNAGEMVSIIDIMLKTKKIREYLENYKVKRITNGSSYLG